jgi:hypothetical protein
MTGTLADRVGFAHPDRRNRTPRRHAASLELMASIALVASTVVAAAVVSIGIARAEALGVSYAADDSLALAVVFGLVLAVWGGLTMLVARNAARRDRAR